jgi:hypothetical protein
MNGERCQKLLSTLLEFCCQPEFSEQMEIARELFSLATGKVNDEDPFYESRMAVFLQYFIFDFRLSDIFSGATIFELFLQRGQSQLSLQELSEFEQLRSCARSLYRVERVHGDGVVVADLFSRRSLFVLPLPDFTLTGFDPGRIFEGRTVSFEGALHFTGAFIFHPEEVAGLIEQHLRDFLVRRTFEASHSVSDWRGELKRRYEILSAVAEQKRMLDASEKRKSVEMLNVSKNLVSVAGDVADPGFVMAIGSDEQVSPFVPETAFYDSTALMDQLAYSELRCFRYKHIGPHKLYSFGKKDFPLAPQSQGNARGGQMEKSAS